MSNNRRAVLVKNPVRLFCCLQKLADDPISVSRNGVGVKHISSSHWKLRHFQRIQRIHPDTPKIIIRNSSESL